MLSLGPPSLSVLVARLGEMEEYEDFTALVREFLPEREEDILQNSTPASRMAAFASYFENRYFPIDDMIKIGELESYYELTRAIPTIVRGFSLGNATKESRHICGVATFLLWFQDHLIIHSCLPVSIISHYTPYPYFLPELGSPTEIL